MSYTAIWTKEAEITFNENIEYLSTSWNLLSINNFLDRIDEVVENIKSNPNYILFTEKMTAYINV